MPYLGIRRQNQTGEFRTNDHRKLAFLLQSVRPMRWTHFAVISAAAAAVTSMFTSSGFADVSVHVATGVRTAILLALSLAILVYSGEHERLPAVSPRTWAVLGLSGLATSVTLIIAGAILAASAR